MEQFREHIKMEPSNNDDITTEEYNNVTKQFSNIKNDPDSHDINMHDVSQNNINSTLDVKEEHFGLAQCCDSKTTVNLKSEPLRIVSIKTEPKDNSLDEIQHDCNNSANSEEQNVNFMSIKFEAQDPLDVSSLNENEEGKNLKYIPFLRHTLHKSPLR